jgi:hypothetical protein
MKRLTIATGLILAILTACARPHRLPPDSPFFAEFLNLYNTSKEEALRQKIQQGAYKDLTLLIVLSPRPLQTGFDLQNCGEISDKKGKPLEQSRQNLCNYYLKFLLSISKMNLQFSPYRFDKPLSRSQKEKLANNNTVGVVYIKRTNTAVLVKHLDRHNVYERIETWFLPFITGLKCNWAGIDVEQWAKPNDNYPTAQTGLANIDMKKKTEPLDSSLIAGYTFSDNYRYNILDHFPHLILSLQ